MIRINLIPPEYGLAQDKKEQKALFLVVICIMAVVMGGIWLVENNQSKALTIKIENANANLRRLQGIVDQISAIEETKRQLTAKRDVILNLNKSRLLYPVFLEDLLPLIPSDIWVTDIRLSGSSGLSLQYQLSCNANTNFAVANWLTNLQQSPHFSNTKISQITYTKGETEGLTILNFQVSFSYQHQGAMPLTEVN